MSDTTDFLLGMVIGGVLGFAAGLMVAPESGDETRQKLKEQAKVEDSDPEEELAEEREAVASFLANANNNQGTEARPAEPVAHRH